VRRISLSLVSLVVLGLLVVGAVRLVGPDAEQTRGKAREAGVSCPEAAERETGAGEEARVEEARAEAAKAEGAGSQPGAGSATGALFSGPAEDPQAECAGAAGHPESFADLAKANSSRISRTVAPGTQVRTGAYAAAVAQRDGLAAAGSAPTGGAVWQPYGDTPLLANRREYDTTRGSTGEGFVGLSGRTTAFARDDAGRLYAATSNGGVWERDPGAVAWKPISDALPSQVVSGVAWSKAGGARGTLLVLTGDNAYGGDTYAGIGAFRSTDGGATWQKAAGLPDGVLGFKLVVDPSDAQKVYAATGGGLFRSTDAGMTYKNVDLPTGAGATGATPDCTGKAPTVKDCFLANMVTDVVVQAAAGKGTPAAGGAVMAAVGWRAGTKHNADGAEQSHGNGMYTSPTGAPGTFTNVHFGKATDNVGATDPIDGQARIGRVALGIADGDAQNHRVVYALVQDAVKFNGGFGALDVNETAGTTSAAQSDFLNGVWVSTDFGANWHQLEGSSTFDTDATSGSALAPPTCKAPAVIGYCPGVQAWYNLWVQPDPTRTTATGIPTRVALGLEEIWNAEDTVTGLDGSTPKKFGVIGKYYAGSTCTLLTVTNALPVCPTQPAGIPKTTTHPDQHGALFVPDGQGGVTLLAANDGGVYRQHTDASTAFDNDHWGDGDNSGLHTLQPYDAEMAKDGTVYMGLQDNGEGKIDPSGKSYTIYGGDGFFTAVDPDHSDIAYEEYTGGDISVTKDGGKTWTDIKPTNLTSAQFSTPFQMDPADANHLMIGGRDIEETTAGPATSSSSWKKVFDLGTQQHRGDAAASASATDPDNQLSALDVRSAPAAGGGPTGPHTADVHYTGGAGTVPLGQDVLGDASTFPPGTTEDHPFTIGAGDGDASADIKISWTDPTSDWDLYVYRKDSAGTLTEVGSSAQGSTTTEEVLLPDPAAGDYVVRVANYTATGTYDAAVTFAQRAAGAGSAASAAYVGFCGFCDTITQGTPFANGIATNVGGAKAGAAGSPDGWHIAAAAGLPSRYITSVQIDPADPRTVYVTLAGYGRRWAFPGAVGEDASRIGTGHVFKSTDAGSTFTDISGNLPDVPANWTVVHDGELVVGTDIGAFISENRAGGSYSVLGTGLPTTPITTMRLKPGDQDLMVVATYGRGVYTYRFPARVPGSDAGGATGTGSGGSGGGAGGSADGAGQTVAAAGSGSPSGAAPGAGGTTSAAGVPVACAATAGFRSVAVATHGGGLSLSAARAVGDAYGVDVFQQSAGRRVLAQRLVARFSGRTAGRLAWAGRKDRRGRPLQDGYYFVRFRVRSGAETDVRRIALRRAHGTFTRRPDFYGRAGCTVIRSAKLSGPAFGGSNRRPLGIAFQLAGAGSAKVAVAKGGKTVLTRSLKASGRTTQRVTLPFRGTTPGDYVVTVTATTNRRTQVVRLTSRRL
jgi:hypothetical protein